MLPAVYLPSPAGLSNAAARRQTSQAARFPRCICQALQKCQMQPQDDKLCRVAKFSCLPYWQPAVSCVWANDLVCKSDFFLCRPSHHVGTLLTLTTLGAKPEGFAVSLKLPAAQIRNMGRGAWAGRGKCVPRPHRRPNGLADERFRKKWRQFLLYIVPFETGFGLSKNLPGRRAAQNFCGRRKAVKKRLVSGI